MRTPSQEPRDYEDDYSTTRGREMGVDPNKVHSSGRGGTGNIHSPTRGAHLQPILDTPLEDQNVISQYAQADVPYSTGRGGLGNFSRSRSRGPGGSPSPQVHSTGKGGYGNLKEGATPPVEAANDHSHDDPTHSTGRGGVANITHSASPGVETAHLMPNEFHSSGRGGAGNILRDRSASRDPEGRSSSKTGALSHLIHKVTGHHEHLDQPASVPPPGATLTAGGNRGGIL